MADEENEGTPAPRAADAITADRRPALAAARTATIGETVTKLEVRRRKVLQGGFFSGLALATLGSLAVTAKFVWPENIKGFGGLFTISADRLPKKGGDPGRIVESKTWLVNLEPGEGATGASTGVANGGLLALYQKCVHLGCTVPWLGGFEFSGTKGWFRCPCHQSTYTKAGVRVFGPAPRSLDTFEIHLDPQGRLVINTGKITLGAEDNPSRTVAF